MQLKVSWNCWQLAQESLSGSWLLVVGCWLLVVVVVVVAGAGAGAGGGGGGGVGCLLLVVCFAKAPLGILLLKMEGQTNAF